MKKFDPIDLLDINMLNSNAQQARFQSAYLKFIAKNNYSLNALGAGISFMIAAASLLSLISFWIPFSIGCLYLVRSLIKARAAAEKKLNSFDKRFLAFMKTEEENEDD